MSQYWCLLAISNLKTKFMNQGSPHYLLEEEMATHFHIFAWKIPWTEKPGGLQSMGLQSRARLEAHIPRPRIAFTLVNSINNSSCSDQKPRLILHSCLLTFHILSTRTPVGSTFKIYTESSHFLPTPFLAVWSEPPTPLMWPLPESAGGSVLFCPCKPYLFPVAATKVPPTEWLEEIEMYWLTVLEARRPNSRCQQGLALSESLNRILLCLFLASGCCCYRSFAKLCPTLCDPVDCSTPGFPVLYYLPEFAQTHVHWVTNAVQPSHPLLSPSPPAFNLSQHQSLPMNRLFTSSGQSIGALASASVLSMNVQSWFPLGLIGLISLQSKGLSSLLQHSLKASILQRSVSFMVQLSHPYMTTGKTTALTRWTRPSSFD